MPARYDRRRRVVQIPATVPRVPLASPYVPLIRPLPATPWTATISNLPEIEPFCHPPEPNPHRNAIWVSPLDAPRDLPPAAELPVWPPPPPVLHDCVPNTPAPPYWWEPGTYPPQPYNTCVPLRLHPHIIYNPVKPSIPILQWDILHRAEQARIFTGRQVIVPANLDAQAVLPNASKIYITSAHPLLGEWMKSWGPIMVEKPEITIRDILDAIYEYFQKPLTRREFRSISNSPYNAASLTLAAQMRARDSYELHSVCLASGFKRVDVMGTHRRFQGLRPVVFQDNTWKLFLGLLPGPVPLT